MTTHLAGCLFRHEIDDYLVDAIQAVVRGDTWFNRTVVERLVTDQANLPHLTLDANKLTQREQQPLLMWIG